MKKIFFLFLFSLSVVAFAENKKLHLSFTSFKQKPLIAVNSLCQDLQNQLQNQFTVNCNEVSPFLYSEERPYLKNLKENSLNIEVIELNTSTFQIEVNQLLKNNSIINTKTINSTDNLSAEIISFLKNNKPSQEKLILQGHNIILDTHDLPVCLDVVQRLESYNFKKSPKSESLKNICNANTPASDRYKTITTLSPTNETYKTQFSHKFLTNTESNILNETRNLSFGMIFAMVGFAALPTSITKWEKTGQSHYADNIKGKPVVDKDEFLINYVGHPVSGAAYYMISRNLGYSKWESFGYSFMMSTFFWEYGFEALAEKPSIQDLISTPILGSILGEYFYNWSQELEQNGSTLWGSKKLGKFALVLMNPAGKLSQSINQFLNRPFIQNSQTQFVIKRQNKDSQKPSNYMGIQLDFKW